MPTEATSETSTGGDRLTRFLLERAGVRGVRVHLDEAWAKIRSREAYPEVVAELLGEACAAAALFTGHAKVDGRLSVQLRSQSTLRTLFAECTAAGTLRGIAQLAEDGGPVSRDLRELGDDAVLAITIENTSRAGTGQSEPRRYQGLVALEADSLSGAFEDYFRQSEQLPTRILLAADADAAAGVMLQKLPGDGGDEDGWRRACALFDTLSPQELLDWPTDLLLSRLFHEDGPQALGDRPLWFACSCSRERVSGMLQALGEEEARAALSDGTAHVRCEFCGQGYDFTPGDIDALFTADERLMEAPKRLQ
ncbi:Hsp33 family molecular chaperone HslO [Luteimonas vadosa]|uniref:Hsp33 family molecular chaperone HslO n=1 Tax=Luteimonas vadosa TaxID=1165507 RepID=A0ABP9E0A2_9GAMM